MRLPELCIRRPVFATVMSLMIVLLGVISFQRLTVREYPKIDTPVVSVRTVYKGASPQVIESQVTQPLEDSLSGIEGVRTIKSVSREEVSQITIEFVLERNVDSAANDVRDRVARVRALLPDAVDEPVVSKIEADAQAIIWLRLSSQQHTSLELTDYADRYVADRLKTLPGVASVIIGGGRTYAMRIWLDRERLAAYALTPQDVENALRRQNVEIPAGRIESSEREFTVLSASDLRSAAQFNDMIVAQTGGYPVRLRDVGEARLGALDERSIVRVNGDPAVGLGVVKQSTANTLSVAQAVKGEIGRIRGSLPPGMQLAVAFDSSVFIERSIEAVYHTMAEAVLLVVLVIFLFLRSFRATLIPFVTIPVALIGAFFFLFLMGFSINVLTLLGVVLAIGLVVDDAIVMLENIWRHIERGETPFRAAIIGAREIGFAVLAMTITLAAVFAPIGFMTGRTGQLFTEFALTLAGAVLVSGFVALTLSPMMCSKLLRHSERHGRIYNLIEGGINRLTAGYQRLLRRALRVRPAVVIVGLAVAGTAYFLFTALKSELTPIEDRGYLIGVAIAPEGATIDFTDRYAKRIEAILARVPEIEKYFMVVGFPVVNQAITFSRLKDWSLRTRATKDIVAELQPQFFGGIPGVLAFPVNPPSLGQSPIAKPLQFVVMTALPYEQLDRAVNALVAEARKFPGLQNIDTDLKLNKPELKVTVDREKAADLGIPIETLGRGVETLLGGRQVTRFKREGKQYDVMVQVTDIERTNPDALQTIFVRSRAGEMVPLANLIKVDESVAPRELNHFNKLRSATITATLAPGVSLGEALGVLEQAAQKTLPATMLTDYAGESREFKESSTALYFTFLLALAFIYLVLAAQFESFIDPFVIMLTVPLSMTGALLALNLTGGSLNIYSQIGLVTLVGLITKHGILLVEFANQLRDRGTDMVEAVVESATLRLRPILMTTGAMVLGTIPLALARGAGGESREQIGWVIVGGLLLGTLFTLFVVPTAYTYLSRRRRAEAEPAASTSPAPAE